MSWNIYLVRTQSNTEPYDQIVDEDYISFSKQEIVNAIMTLAKEFSLFAENIDTKFPHLRGDGWSIEFCFWDEQESYEIVEMQVRGIHEPIEVFEKMKSDLNARIFDMHGGTFVEADRKRGFDEWVDFTAKIIEDLTKKE